MMLELNLAIIGLILSIIFSSSEIALISANKLQIDVWIKQKYRFGLLTKNILAPKNRKLFERKKQLKKTENECMNMRERMKKLKFNG